MLRPQGGLTCPMKIITYNIRHWENRAGMSNVQHVLRVLDEANGDIIGLNEVLHPFPSPDPNLSALAFLARELGLEMAFAPAFQPTNAFHLPEVMSGNALLSRWPILASAAHHLTPVLKNQRGLLEGRVLLPDNSTLTLYVTHLEPKSEDVRVEQTRALLSWTIRDRDRPHVLMGDLNTYHPGDYANETDLNAFRAQAEARGFTFFQAKVIPMLLKQGYVDACARHPQPTWDADDELWARMDFILLSKPLAPALQSCRTINTPEAQQASDHLPVVATLNLLQP